MDTLIATRKGRKRNTCQVADCSNPLPSDTLYHRRYRICVHHAGLASITLNGVPTRFCQQCGRFQNLADFDADKRSCRRKLNMHNAQRKRARDAAKGAALAAGPSEFKLRSGANEAPVRAAVSPIKRSVYEPDTPACRSSGAPGWAPTPFRAAPAALQSFVTHADLIYTPDIDDFDIDEALQSLEDGTSVATGLQCANAGLGSSVGTLPAALPPPVLQHSTASMQSELLARQGAGALSGVSVPPADLNTLLQPGNLLVSPFLVGGIPFFVPPPSLMPLMPPDAGPAPRVRSAAQQATDTLLVVSAPNATQIVRKPAA